MNYTYKIMYFSHENKLTNDVIFVFTIIYSFGRNGSINRW